MIKMVEYLLKDWRYLLKQALPLRNRDVAEKVQLAWVSAKAVQLIDKEYLDKSGTGEKAVIGRASKQTYMGRVPCMLLSSTCSAQRLVAGKRRIVTLNTS